MRDFSTYQNAELSPRDIEEMYSWGDVYFDQEGELVEEGRLSSASDVAPPEERVRARLTGRFGTDAGDLTSEAINSGQMSPEERRLLQRDLEAIERGSSTESVG